MRNEKPYYLELRMCRIKPDIEKAGAHAPAIRTLNSLTAYLITTNFPTCVGRELSMEYM